MTGLQKAALAAVLAAGLGLSSAYALDARYKDADGDLVADAPTDPRTSSIRRS